MTHDIHEPHAHTPPTHPNSSHDVPPLSFTSISCVCTRVCVSVCVAWHRPHIGWVCSFGWLSVAHSPVCGHRKVKSSATTGGGLARHGARADRRAARGPHVRHGMIRGGKRERGHPGKPCLVLVRFWPLWFSGYFVRLVVTVCVVFGGGFVRVREAVLHVWCR